jgi:hypothetical protein
MLNQVRRTPCCTHGSLLKRASRPLVVADSEEQALSLPPVCIRPRELSVLSYCLGYHFFLQIRLQSRLSWNIWRWILFQRHGYHYVTVLDASAYPRVPNASVRFRRCFPTLIGARLVAENFILTHLIRSSAYSRLVRRYVLVDPSRLCGLARAIILIRKINANPHSLLNSYGAICTAFETCRIR